jgi:hypothetical protein
MAGAEQQAFAYPAQQFPAEANDSGNATFFIIRRRRPTAGDACARRSSGNTMIFLFDPLSSISATQPVTGTGSRRDIAAGRNLA